MKKIWLFLFCVIALSLSALGEFFEFAPDFSNRKSWTTPAMRFGNQNNFRFLENNATLNRPMLIVKRGGLIPNAKLTNSLGNNEDFSYSYSVMRLEDNSSMCSFLENNKHQVVGGIFIHYSGRVQVYTANKRYESTNMILKKGEIYNISVVCSRADNSMVVKVEGLGEWRNSVIFPENLNNFVFAPQPPVGNTCVIDNFKFSVTEMKTEVASNVKVFAPDLTNKNSWTGQFGRFLEQDKLRFEKSELNGNRPMLINHRGAVRPAIKLSENIGENEDFGYSFDIIRTADNSSTCVGLTNDKNENTGLIFINMAGDLLLFGNQNRYENTGINLKVGKMYNIAVRCTRETESAEVEVKGVGKFTARVKFAPNLNRLQFAPQQPEGNICLLDNIEIHVFPGRVFTRENALKNVTPKLQSSGKIAAGLTDGNINQSLFLSAKEVIEFNLEKRITATGIQIFSGAPEYRDNPSGACGLASYRVEGLHNGAWAVLVEAKNIGDKGKSGVFSSADFFDRRDFDPIVIDGLRIVLLESYDTGNRLSGAIARDQYGVNLREIEIFSDKKVAIELDVRDFVNCDWELPVYRNRDKATFIAYIAKHPSAPKEAKLIIKNVDGTVACEQKMSLQAGKNSCTVDIADLNDGRYMTEFVTGKQKIRGLLRIEKVPAIQAPAEPLQMAGKKMFFTPDDYSLAESKNLKVEIAEVKTRKLAQTPSEDKLLLFGNDFYQATDGRFIMRVTDRSFKNTMFGSDSYRILASDSLDGEFTQIDKAPAAKARPQIFSPNVGFAKPPQGTKFELYDAAKHGKIPLNRLATVYNYFPTDYGCFKATRRSIYVVGKTVDNKWVMMRNEPLFIDKTLYGDNDFDNGFYSNDNFGGMWLSPDGKECYWSQGQTMKRDRAFVAPYDNFATGIRMMGVYSTTDGINWKYRYCVSVPDENDPKAYQHYGMMRTHVKNSDLYLVYLLAYDSLRQQIIIELNYSRDGVSFHRFPGNTLFLATKKWGDWFFGHMFIGNIVHCQDGKYYQLGTYATPLPHFAFESIMGKNKLAEVTAADYRKRFESRGLEQEWPYFKEIGGYEGLAELTRNGYYAAGLLEFREDGWFSLNAGSETGSFRSRTVSGVSKIYANAEVAADGVFEIELVDKATNKVVATKSISGDNVKHELFAVEPNREYYLRGKMQNAKLYTFIFE